MSPVRLVVLMVVLPAIIGVERFANYAVRTLLITLMHEPASSGGLGLTTEQAVSTYGWFGMLGGVTPLLGGLVAVAIGPRIPMVLGALCGAIAYVVLAMASPSTLALSLVLWAVGYGLLVPCLYAVVAREFAGAGEGYRLAPFLLMYAAVNVGAVIATPAVSGLQSLRVEPTAVCGAAAALMVVVTVGLAGVALLGTRQTEPTSGGRVELGLVIVLALLMPGIAVSALGFGVIIEMAAGSASAALLFAINPVVVIVTATAVAIGAILYGALRKSPPTLAMLGVGTLILTFGTVPLLLGGSAPSMAIQVSAVVIMAIGEPLVLALGAARMAIGTHRRFAALVLAVWFAATRGIYSLSDVISGQGWSSPALALAAVACVVAGVVLLALGSFLQRTFFAAHASRGPPEPPASSIPPEPTAA